MDDIQKHLCKRISILPYIHNVLADEFLSFDIISNLDFGSGYSAGTSLKNIAMFYGATAYPYINSKYKNSFLDPPFEQGNPILELIYIEMGYSPVIKLLSELTLEDMILLYPEVSIQFTEAPSVDNHTFTMTMVTKEKTITKSFDVAIE